MPTIWLKTDRQMVDLRTVNRVQIFKPEVMPDGEYRPDRVVMTNREFYAVISCRSPQDARTLYALVTDALIHFDDLNESRVILWEEFQAGKETDQP